MDSSIALWALCFLISTVVMVMLGQIGLAMFSALILAVGLLVANE
jgi:hypothetical protein